MERDGHGESTRATDSVPELCVKALVSKLPQDLRYRVISPSNGEAGSTVCACSVRPQKLIHL